MSTKGFSRQIRVTSPCNTPWESMLGNDRVRFCEHCHLSVHNLDLASRKQTRRLIAKSRGRLCVRYLEPVSRSENVSRAPVLHQINRRTARIAASAVSAALGFSSVMAANVHPKETAYSVEVISVESAVERFSNAGSGTLRGYVFDPKGDAIAGASVSVTNAETMEGRYSISGGDGQYRFEGLTPGSYHLTIKAQGFAESEVRYITVRADDNNQVDQTLSIARVVAEVDIQALEQTAISGAAAMMMPTDPLVKAALEDDLEALKNVLLTRPDASARDNSTQYTALEHAVQHGNREMVQVLLWSKADVNARDNDGQTILMLLSDNVTSEIIWDLVNAGAKVNLRDKDGDSALIAVADLNNVEALKTLLDAGAKVNVTNNVGQTALMIAASGGRVHNVRALILAGADVNARDKEGKSALMYAISENETAVARLLKAHGAIEFPEPEKP